MPLFLRTHAPQRREKLILGGALTYSRHRRPLRHRALSVIKKRPVKPSPLRRHRPAAVKRRRRPVVITKRPRDRAARTAVTTAQRRLGKAKHKKKSTFAAKMFGKVAAKTKRALNKFAQSSGRKTMHALSQQLPQLAQTATDVGRHLANRGLSEIGRKRRPLEGKEEGPAAKRPHVSYGKSRVGYRGQTIHRGGSATKQEEEKKSFLF